jgi:ribosome-binding protein aMBF1 (putative translation factor)
MANRHSLMWRRNAERERFRRLMKKVEAIRLRDGMTKKALAAEIGIDKDVLRSRLAGEAVGRAESVAKLLRFLKSREIA